MAHELHEEDKDVEGDDRIRKEVEQQEVTPVVRLVLRRRPHGCSFHGCSLTSNRRSDLSLGNGRRRLLRVSLDAK